MLIEILILLFIMIIFYEIFNDSCNHYEGFATNKSKKKSSPKAEPEPKSSPTPAPKSSPTPSPAPTITTVTPVSNVTTTSSAPSIQPATSNDPMILSQKNAGQILLLKDQYNSQTKSMNDIKNYMTKLFDNVETLNDQIEAIKSNK